jgi:hypothetical protein
MTLAPLKTGSKVNPRKPPPKSMSHRDDLRCHAEVVAFHSPRRLFDSPGLGQRSRVQRDHRSHR